MNNPFELPKIEVAETEIDWDNLTLEPMTGSEDSGQVIDDSVKNNDPWSETGAK